MISVDTKKKELVGEFKNAGREWQPQGQPEETRVHDFLDKVLGKAIPYGVYDLADDSGWVSVVMDHDTAEFATDSILSWWKNMGCKSFQGRFGQSWPEAVRLSWRLKLFYISKLINMCSSYLCADP